MHTAEHSHGHADLKISIPDASAGVLAAVRFAPLNKCLHSTLQSCQVRGDEVVLDHGAAQLQAAIRLLQAT